MFTYCIIGLWNQVVSINLIEPNYCKNQIYINIDFLGLKVIFKWLLEPGIYKMMTMWFTMLMKFLFMNIMSKYLIIANLPIYKQPKPKPSRSLAGQQCWAHPGMAA